MRAWTSLLTLLLLAPVAHADDHADGATGATPLSLGAAAAGRIDRAGDRDVFRLGAEQGARYVVETSGLDGGMDTILDLYDPSGAHVLRDDDGGDGLASRLEFAATVTGGYYVTVVHYDAQAASGGYRVAARRVSVAPTPAAPATPSTPPTPSAPTTPAAPAASAGAVSLSTRVLDPKLPGAALEVTTQAPGAGDYAARVEVVDADGQTVRVLSATRRERGRAYRDGWDGRDASGAFAAPGSYTVRFGAEGAASDAPLNVVRLGVTGVAFGGAGRVPLAYHHAEQWSGSAFPLDNAGAAWTAPASPLGAGCLDGADGEPLAGPRPWGDLDGPPRAASGSLLQRGRSLPVGYVAGTPLRVGLLLGDAAAAGGAATGCGYPIPGRPLRIVIDGGISAASMTGELTPGTQVTLDGAPLPETLGKHALRLRIRFAYQEQDGSWSLLPGAQTTEHVVYTLLARPGAADLPDGTPWVAALDLASDWLGSGTRSRAALLARIVEGINARVGLRYDMVSGAPAYTFGYRLASPDLDLTAFLAQRAYGSTVNCLDCASLVTAFAAQLGAPGRVNILGWDFDLNFMRGIGWPNFSRDIQVFSYHAVCSFDAEGDVHDACLCVDDDDRPWQAPFLERLPVDMPLSRYRQQLSSEWFESQEQGRASVQ